jgi:peptidoglycan-associated lipoprotein
LRPCPRRVRKTIERTQYEAQVHEVVRTYCYFGHRHHVGRRKMKVAPPPPPPPPPTASISVNPTSIQPGQSATLTWQTANATDVSIEGLGAVQTSGSQAVSPSDSTDYNLVPKGAGGTQNTTTHLTVTQPAPSPPPPPAGPTDEELFEQNIKDIYFDYDKADLRDDQNAALQADMLFLNQHPNINFTIEGRCDERGSAEYNLALGDKRATAVKNALTIAAINASRINVISLGKEKPFCSESNEACWQQNRRGHSVYQE